VFLVRATPTRSPAIAKSKLGRKDRSPVRLQYGALPYRFSAAGEVELLLVTSRARGRWIIPKGWPIKGLKPPRSAAREAFEEAGVRGDVGDKPIGCYPYDKISDDEGSVIPCEVLVFALHVKRQLEDWPEASEREVRWMKAEEAKILIEEDSLRSVVEVFAEKARVGTVPGGSKGKDRKG
jgi:8-oxo-dGTP pyrophosphatase MutT (NUDIX family)